MPPRRPRALIVAYCFPPHAAIGTYRTLRLVSHLAANGWEVDVLTAAPESYLAGTPLEPRLLDRVPPNVRVMRTTAFRGFTTIGKWIEPVKQRVRRSTASTDPAPAAVPPATSGGTRTGLKTAVEELCAMPDKDIGWLAPAVLRAALTLARRPPEVIFSSAPPWTTHLVAERLASIFRCGWVADFRDPWVRSPWTRYHTSPAAAIARRLERRVVQRADAVVFTTQTARGEFASHYGPPLDAKFHVVFNGCDPTELAPEAPPESRSFTILHAGSLYGGRSPLPLLEALAALRHTHKDAARLKLRFLGSTGFPGVDVTRVCRQLGIGDAVEFVARVPRDESLAAMRAASALLILQGGTTMAIPGKLYEYLANGRPVLALCEPGEMADFINGNRLGMAVSPTDQPAIHQALRRLLDEAGSWMPAPPALFDGRLRAAELAVVMESVMPAARPARRVAVSAAPGGQRG